MLGQPKKRLARPNIITAQHIYSYGKMTLSLSWINHLIESWLEIQ